MNGITEFILGWVAAGVGLAFNFLLWGWVARYGTILKYWLP